MDAITALGMLNTGATLVNNDSETPTAIYLRPNE